MSDLFIFLIGGVVAIIVLLILVGHFFGEAAEDTEALEADDREQKAREQEEYYKRLEDEQKQRDEEIRNDLAASLLKLPLRTLEATQAGPEIETTGLLRGDIDAAVQAILDLRFFDLRDRFDFDKGLFSMTWYPHGVANERKVFHLCQEDNGSWVWQTTTYDTEGFPYAGY